MGTIGRRNGNTPFDVYDKNESNKKLDKKFDKTGGTIDGAVTINVPSGIGGLTYHSAAAPGPYELFGNTWTVGTDPTPVGYFGFLAEGLGLISSTMLMLQGNTEIQATSGGDISLVGANVSLDTTNGGTITLNRKTLFTNNTPVYKDSNNVEYKMINTGVLPQINITNAQQYANLAYGHVLAVKGTGSSAGAVPYDITGAGAGWGITKLGGMQYTKTHLLATNTNNEDVYIGTSSSSVFHPDSWGKLLTDKNHLISGGDKHIPSGGVAGDHLVWSADGEATWNAMVPDRGMKNLLINGGFDVWQRGISFDPNQYRYTADRWWAYQANAGSVILRQEVNTVGNYDLKIATGSNTTIDLRTSVELVNGKSITNGGKLTLSFYASYPVGSSVNVAIGYADNMSLVNVVYLSNLPEIGLGVGSYKLYTVTVDDLTPANTNECLVVRIFGGENSSSHYIAQVQLEEGSVATPFEQRPYGLELSLCQRYYETIINTLAGDGAKTSIGIGQAEDTNKVNLQIQYSVKRVPPSMKTGGNFQVAPALRNITAFTQSYAGKSMSKIICDYDGASYSSFSSADIRASGIDDAYFAFDAEIY